MLMRHCYFCHEIDETSERCFCGSAAWYYGERPRVQPWEPAANDGQAWGPEDFSGTEGM